MLRKTTRWQVMEDFGAIPVFVAVVEQGSFSAAAIKLGITKSAVSKRITQLETRLGARLIQRSTRKLSLTEAGEAYLGYAMECRKAAMQAEDAVSEMQGDPRGLLRVSAPMSFGRLHLAPLVPALMKRYPALKLDLVLDDRRVDLVEGGFDVAMRAGNLPDSSLIARRLAPCRVVLCASPDYLAGAAPVQRPEDLRDHDCLTYSYLSNHHEWTFETRTERQKITVSGRYQVNNSEALREAVIGGLGIARIPTFIVGPDLASGRLIQVLPDYPVETHTLYAVFPERLHMPAKVRAFLDFAVESFGGETPVWDCY
ncbi:LysR family transcriptional regulator [Aestuariispira insulae]|uniref:DNA-binding transcriptional LysR family regulator n=1 Tax=Aestuariispira insulae TaxID=1461337 RepID=A0A3D9HE34_9PROT|nr:LysR family transcriptional regulator [Aestuariispira insulae]RED47748.1 DNA-binding transcriptional LysR family regulator [Aestuariispira insulae]